MGAAHLALAFFLALCLISVNAGDVGEYRVGILFRAYRI